LILIFCDLRSHVELTFFLPCAISMESATNDHTMTGARSGWCRTTRCGARSKRGCRRTPTRRREPEATAELSQMHVVMYYTYLAAHNASPNNVRLAHTHTSASLAREKIEDTRAQPPVCQARRTSFHLLVCAVPPPRSCSSYVPLKQSRLQRTSLLCPSRWIRPAAYSTYPAERSVRPWKHV
jgi:hypothetical protein